MFDSGNVWNFGGTVEESNKKKNVAVADSDCDEDDWEGVWTEGKRVRYIWIWYNSCHMHSGKRAHSSTHVDMLTL